MSYLVLNFPLFIDKILDQRYYLEGKQGVKDWPLVSAKGAALFEVRLLTEVLLNSSEGVTEIIVDIKYWILVYDTRKLNIMRAKRKWEKKYTNLGYDDPVELKRACEQYLKEKKKLTLNLGEITFIDIYGIKALRELIRQEVELSNCSFYIFTMVETLNGC